MPGHRPVPRLFTTVILLTALVTSLATGCAGKSAKQVPQPEPPATQGPPKSEAPQPKPGPALPGAVAVMIENSPMARPQSGLQKADLVYEMESEYGISRFMALFYTKAVDKIGPVRSARMGFFEVASAYGLPYAHAGGSLEVLRELEFGKHPLLNLDDIYSCSACFWRSGDRKAPHNLYTSTERLVTAAEKAKFALKPLVPLAAVGPMEGGKPAAELAFSWGPKTQTVAWSWNGKRYLRSQSEEPHVMQDGAQVEADNLILLFTHFSWNATAQPDSGLHTVTIVGKGDGYLYRGGQVYPIRWEKAGRGEHYRFTLPDGKPIHLAEGQTWVEILKSADHIEKGLP